MLSFFARAALGVTFGLASLSAVAQDGPTQSTCTYMQPPNPAAVICYTQQYSCYSPIGCVAVSCTLTYVYKEIDESYLASSGWGGNINTVPVSETTPRSQLFSASNAEIGGEILASAPLTAIQQIQSQLVQRILWETNQFIAQDAALQCQP